MKKRILILLLIIILGLAGHFYLNKHYKYNKKYSSTEQKIAIKSNIIKKLKTVRKNKIVTNKKGAEALIESKKIVTTSRESIDNKYKWNLNDIYVNWDGWKKDITTVTKMMKSTDQYQGKLSENSNTLADFLELQEKIDILVNKLYIYPYMQKDLDSSNQEVSAKLQEIATLASKYQTDTAWIVPEILSIPKERVIKWIKENKRLLPYKFNLLETYRLRDHTLDHKSEKLISYYNQYNEVPTNIYQELSTSDVKWSEVKFKDGKTLPMTYGNYSKIMATDRDQNERKKAFNAHYQTFANYKNSYAAIYRGILQRDFAIAQIRHYNSALESALETNNIPVSVYKNLIKVAKENSEPLKRYNRIRKKQLKLDNYHNYDGSIPLISTAKEYDYDKAKEYVNKSVVPLGKEYSDDMKKALSSGWIDVYETEGKRAGAYSLGVYGVHPYMLLNYNKTLDNVFTLAHELGHTMHTMLSDKNQPFSTHNYTIFIAEVASTFNEKLLLNYMLQNTTDPKEKIVLLEQAIRGAVGTYYFQCLLADYELQAHSLIENGKAITPDALSGIMKKLFVEYYGDSVESDKLMNVLWARIPHFFNSPYYVYQYATSYAASSVFYDKITNPKYSGAERKDSLNNYLTLLKSGGNDSPMNQLKKAGVDLSQEDTVKAVSNNLDLLLDQLEVELNKLEQNKEHKK